MTREETLEKIKKSMECHDRKVCGLAETCEECPLYVDKDTEYEAHKMLIKALLQEPCTDAVSREAILNKIKEVCFSKEWVQFRINNGSHGQRDFLIDYIEQLPSVTQKSGKCRTCKYWQDNNNGYPSDMCKWRTDETPDADDYCSEYEPQEGEDKE